MTTIEIRHIEDCLDGSFIKEIVLNQLVTKNLIMSLSQIGDLQYYDSFARPFFKLRKQDEFECKGVEGNRSIRIVLTNNPEKNLKQIVDLINQFFSNSDS